jgi:hypothetical protein
VTEYVPQIAPAAHVLVGSSPFHLVLGIELLTGSRGDVVIVEAADRPGGAWRVGEVFGIRELELGTHFLTNDPAGYAMLERSGVSLPELRPRPSVLVARPVGATAPDLVKNCGLFGYGTLRRNRFYERATHDARIRALRTRTRAAVVPWRYPSLGCAELVRDLVARFTDLGGQLLLGRRVTALHEHDDRVVCALGDGESLDAEQVHVSPNHDGIRVDGLVVPETVTRCNVLLDLAGAAPRAFSFVQVKGDGVIHAVSDIGRFARTPPGRVVLAVLLRNRAFDELGASLPDIVERRLRRLGILRGPDQVAGVHVERTPIQGPHAVAAWTRATASSRRIRVRSPVDLVESLAELARAADRGVMA